MTGIKEIDINNLDFKNRWNQKKKYSWNLQILFRFLLIQLDFSYINCLVCFMKVKSMNNISRLWMNKLNVFVTKYPAPSLIWFLRFMLLFIHVRISYSSNRWGFRRCQSFETLFRSLLIKMPAYCFRISFRE